jgi:predicted Zn-dependent protease
LEVPPERSLKITGTAAGDAQAVALASFTPPATLRKRFDIGGVIGSGAFGFVCLATRKADGSVLVIKFITLLNEVEGVARFLQEARLHSEIVHENLVRTYEAGVADGYGYLVSEYCAGGTLRQLLERDRILGPAVTLRLTYQYLAGLATCHARGVVHRDLKPENILFDANGNAKLADLGVAKALDSVIDLTLTGSVLGTPAYMAPEALAGGRPSPLSDLYAVGLLLHEMLAGQPAFPNSHDLSVLARLKATVPPLLCDLVPEVSEDLSLVVRRLLSPAPEGRPQTVDELIVELSRSTSGASGSTPPRQRLTPGLPPLPGDGVPERATSRFFGRTTSPRKWLAALILLVTGLAIGAGTFRLHWPDSLVHAEELLRNEAEPRTVMELVQPFLHDPRLEGRAQACMGGALMLLSRVYDARAPISRARTVQNEDVGGRVLAGDFLLRTNARASALNALQGALRREPQCVAAHALLCVAYDKNGQTKEAEKHLRQALATAPTDPRTCRIVAQCLASKGRYLDAGQLVARGIARWPSWTAGHFWHGMYLGQAGDREAAARAFQTGRNRKGFVPLEPLLYYLDWLSAKDPPAVVEPELRRVLAAADPQVEGTAVSGRLVRFLRNRHQEGEALEEELRQLRALERLNVEDACLRQGVILREGRRFVESEAALRRAMRSPSKEIQHSGRFELGRLFLCQGRAQEALPLLQALVAEGSEVRGKAAIVLSSVLAQDGMLDKASETLARAGESGRVRWWVHAAVAQLLVKEGHSEAAAHYCWRLIKLGPVPQEIIRIFCRTAAANALTEFSRIPPRVSQPPGLKDLAPPDPLLQKP